MRIGVSCGLLFLSILCGVTNAQRYVLTRRIPFPGNQGYWDYLIADDSARLLYVTRGDELQVVNLDTGKQVAIIKGFKKIHGVALAKELGKGFITDGGDDAVVVFNLKSNSVAQKIKVGLAPDAILYEPTKKRVYAFNAHSHSVSVIDATTDKVISAIPLSGGPEFAATDGNGNVFVNIETKNSLVRLDPSGTKVQSEWSLKPCKEPSGLAIDARNHRLFSACSNKVMIVTDGNTGKQVAVIPIGSEPDAAVYDSKHKLVFSSNEDGTLTVIKQDSPDRYTVLQNLVTEPEARTMALDRATQRIFLPTADVKVPTDNPEDLPVFKPETFHLIIVAPRP